MVTYRDTGVKRIVLDVWPRPGGPAMVERYGRETVAELA
jgi:hypothetical protein